MQNLDYNRLLRLIDSIGSPVTSVAISGTDGIQVDSGSPITSSGTIVLGIDKATLALLLDELDNVTITAATDGQVLTYDDDTGEWVNADAASGFLSADGGDSSTTVFETYLDGGDASSTYSFFHVIDGGYSG